MQTVSILGLASCVPDSLASPARFDQLARRWAKPSVALDKTLLVNSRTGIDHRPSIHSETSPILLRPSPPPIQEIVDVFLQSGGALALTASQRAITDWGRPASEITHLICTTCTASSHPGYDLYLHQQLGLSGEVERTLIHGIGCAGGLSIVRLARNICVAAEAQGRKARVLIVALEVTSTLVRTELESIDEESERGGTRPNVASTIFSDAASAMIVGSGALEEDEHQSFEVQECVAETVPETEGDLAFNIRENGWRAVLTPRVPTLTATAVPALYTRLLSTVASRSPPIPSLSNSTRANELDWLIHPGGALILTSLTKILSLAGPRDDPTQTTPSWQMYRERGNASSASIGGVMERGRLLGGREEVVAVAFGPGLTVEMALLKRTGWRGRKYAAGQNGVPNGTIEVGHDQTERTGEVVAEAKEELVEMLDGRTEVLGDRTESQKANGHVESKMTNGHAENTMANGHTESTMANGHVESKRVKESRPKVVGVADRCVCISRPSIFGGSGLDCWCRS